MFKKTAIALSLAMVAGTGFAQTNTMSNAHATVGANGDSMNAGVSANSSLAAKFHQLDLNHDGLLSASEAKADPRVASLYDSMDTGASMRTDTAASTGAKAQAGGITMDQFKAGLQAAAAGNAGPAVSGGGTYTQMRDGSMKKMQSMRSGVHSKVSSMHNGMSSSASQMQNNAMQSGSQMGNSASSSAASAYGNARSRMQGASQTAGNAMSGAMQNGASVGAGASVGTGATMQNGGGNN